MDAFQGFLRSAGKQLVDQAQDALVGKAKEMMMGGMGGGAMGDVLGNVISEIFVKKTSDTKRVLPSIKNMKIVRTYFGTFLF